jgi:hypothetical protein
MSEQPTLPTPVQNALNLICEIKSPADQQQLQAMLESHVDYNKQILDSVGTVHFARFLFLNNNTQIALFTEYDGDLETYVMDFVKVAHDLFNALLSHVASPPPLPVEKFPQEFLQWVQDHDLPCAVPLYSAYPTIKVQDIVVNLVNG